MDVILNELCFEKIAETQNEATQWMIDFFQIPETLSKRLHKIIYIKTTRKLKEVLIGVNYSFAEWLHTLTDRDLQRRIISSLIHRPILERYPYYYYEKRECSGLGLAYESKDFAVSYPKSLWGNTISIEKEYFTPAGEVIKEKCVLNNLSSSDDVFYFFPKAYFEHHKKHDNKRSNLNDGESTLFYDIPNMNSKVQKLLDSSIRKNFHSEKLYNFDENVNKYIEFNSHGKDKYHGYHIEDQTRVPNFVKLKIEKFIKK